MQVLIHTSGRADVKRQPTLTQLVQAGIDVALVVQDHEADKYREMLATSGWSAVPVHALPPAIRRLSPTRDWIIHDMGGPDHVVFMDDDLHFAVRRHDDRTKFRQPEPKDIRHMVHAIDEMLGDCPMVGIGSREGGNRVTECISYNTRIMRVLAFNRKVLQREQVTFSPLVVREDFHVNLQLLRRGYDTCVLNNWVSNQAGGSNASGGCSVYRDSSVQTESAHLLAARHPGFVKVVEKTTKTAWGGATRTDVMVQWKQARKAGGVR